MYLLDVEKVFGLSLRSGGGDMLLEAEKCAALSTYCKINTLACTSCVSILLDPNFHRFSCSFFFRDTVFIKYYSFSLRLTVSLSLRGSLQRKPGFLWCIPKCLGERNRSGVWISSASSACHENSRTLYGWYMPRHMRCGWSAAAAATAPQRSVPQCVQ